MNYLFGLATLAMATASEAIPAALSTSRPTIILVHGAFVDGSGWAGVHRILTKEGFPVVVVQNPTNSLADDVAVTNRAIAAAAGSVVLVGHSYGGVIITEAGSDPKVSSLVYIAAFAPDQGESVSSLIANAPVGVQGPPIVPSADGFLTLDRAKFASAFASDVPSDAAQFMADSQVPWGIQAFEGKVGTPAWKSKPSWYLVTEDDRIIPPDAQRGMARRANATVLASAGSHAIYVAAPETVAALIRQTAKAASVTASSSETGR
jgi:pimeloyl-ACP methyl ester carboxylesterase